MKEELKLRPYLAVHIEGPKYKLFIPYKMMIKYEVFEVFDLETNSLVGKIFCSEHPTVMKDEEFMYSSIVVVKMEEFELPKSMELKLLCTFHPELKEK